MVAGTETILTDQNVIDGARVHYTDVTPEIAASTRFIRRGPDRRGTSDRPERGLSDQLLKHLGQEATGSSQERDRQAELLLGSLAIPDIDEENRLGQTNRRQGIERRGPDDVPAGMPPIL